MLPRLIILDDLFGRNVPDGRNTDRENLCAHFLWRDATGDAAAKATKQEILQPTAEAVFCRAQSPASSRVGDIVENDLEAALEAVRQGLSREKKTGFKNLELRLPWSMVLIDLCFYTGLVTEESHRRTPGMPEGRPGDDDPRQYFGLTLLDIIYREFPELPVFILSSKPRSEVSLEFSRRGALGFIDRSALDGPELLQQALWHHGLLPDTSGNVVGRSLPILLALREARRSGGHRENVLIRGEKGSGKELFARYVHASRNQDLAGECPKAKINPLVTVNSAVFTPNLFGSELFGIEPRTATGVDGKTGLIEEADGGELFFDEIGDMPPEVQAALLRVLQDRQITKVGSRKSLPMDVRFLSATNVDLDDSERGFRSDLLDRLRLGGTIWIPPLRKRLEDLPLLVEQFVREAEKARPGTCRREVSPEAVETLAKHYWPGNVRELRSVIFQAVTAYPDVEHLVPAHLSVLSGERRSSSSAIESKVSPTASAVAASESSGAKAVPSGMEPFLPKAFEPSNIAEWTGSLSSIQHAHAQVIAGLLGAAIEVTKRRTPDHPEGAVQIHPAAKLATGESTITASQAADLFKRLLSPIENELEGDLRKALEISLRLRPKSYRRRTNTTTSG